jgi:hypothetical protein
LAAVYSREEQSLPTKTARKSEIFPPFRPGNAENSRFTDKRFFGDPLFAKAWLI